MSLTGQLATALENYGYVCPTQSGEIWENTDSPIDSFQFILPFGFLLPSFAIHLQSNKEQGQVQMLAVSGGSAPAEHS